jgi:hypothetical protein
MSTNLGTILVGLGYDLSALEKGAPEAFRLINSQTLGMSAEMKRASREGAESFRLIDEALGIHLSRPLTRILTQEFPSLAKGLQSVLGAGVVGALAVGAFEGIEKGLEKIEQAKQKQEEWAKSTVETQKVMAEGSEYYAESLEMVRAKLAAVNGDPGPLHQLEQIRELGKNVDETRKFVDQLGDAMQKEAKAAEDAGSLSTRAWLFVADIPKTLVQGINAADPFGGSGSWLKKMFDQGDQTAQLKAVFASMKDNLDQAFAGDKINGTHEALRLVTEDLKTANFELEYMKNNGNAAGAAIADQGVRFLTTVKQWIEALDQLNEQQKKLQAAQDAAAALEKETAAVKAFYAEISSAGGKIAPDNDPIHKLEAEIDAARAKAITDFDEMRKAGASALTMDHALAALDLLEKKFDSVLADAKATAALAIAAQGLPTKIATGPAPQLGGATPIAPTLGAGGTTGAQYDVFSKDQTAQLKLAAQAYQDIVTPAQKFSLTQSELNLLLKEGLIDQTAYTAAMQKAREEEAKGTDQLQKLLEKTDSAAAGMQAFFLQLENGAGKSGSGTFTFDLLNKGLQGFEDETVKALTGAKTNWRSYFESLDQMALKFMLNKEIAGLFKMLSNTSFGKNLGLGSLLGGSAASPAQAANTTAVTANTAAVTSLTAAMQAALAGGGGYGGGGTYGGNIGGVDDSDVEGYATGTPDAPGGWAMVGEDGPELVDLPAGAAVTANSAMRSGSNTPIVVHIDAKGAELGVEEKISRAITAAAPQLIGRAVVEAAEAQRRSPH